jgi:hypothetical protein
VCASCSKWEHSFENKFRWIDFEDLPLNFLRNSQIPRDLLPDTYDVDVYEGAILNAKGMQNKTGKGPLLLCPSCQSDLLDQRRMPKFALANWLYYAVEKLPVDVRQSFDCMSPFELQLVMRASACKIIHRYSDKNPALGNQHYTKGNLMSVMTDHVNLRKHLPPFASEVKDTMAVLFVGQEKPSKDNIKKLCPILVSKSRVKTVIDFLKKNNPYYQPDEGFEGFSQEAFDSYSETNGDEAGPSTLPAELSVHHLKPSEAEESLESDYTDRNSDENPNGCSNGDLLMENVGYTDGDRSDGNFTEMKLHAVQHCLLGGKFLMSRRGNRPLSDFESKEIMTWSFPNLDPHGIGGFNDPRRIRKLSMKEHLTHLLSIDDSPFEKDPSFAFMFYNIIRKKSNMESVHFRIKGRQRTFIINALREIQASPQSLSNLAEKFTNDHNYKPVTSIEKKIMTVMNKINMIPRDSPASLGCKQDRRNEIRGLINKYGAPALFVTLNPADVLHPLVRLLCGENVDLENSARNTPITKTAQRQLVADNPAAATRFFNIMMKMFVEILLLNNCPGKCGVGIFGKCKAYYGMVEAQGKGTLHCHMLIWLDGHLSPRALQMRMSRDESFKK